MKAAQIFISALVTVLSLLAQLGSAFTWNRQNIEALFANSDVIFDELSVAWPPEEESTCLDQFRVFVNQLKTTQGWAISCKYRQI